MKKQAKIINIVVLFVWLFLTIIIGMPFVTGFKFIPLNYFPEHLQTGVLMAWILLNLGGLIWFSENRRR